MQLGEALLEALHHGLALRDHVARRREVALELHHLALALNDVALRGPQARPRSMALGRSFARSLRGAPQFGGRLARAAATSRSRRRSASADVGRRRGVPRLRGAPCVVGLGRPGRVLCASRHPPSPEAGSRC